MKKYLIACAVALTMIAGCTSVPKTVVIDNTKIVVIKPHKSLFNCPQLGAFPDYKTLTNKQVADIIAKLYKYHKICSINIKQIEKFIEQAEINNKKG